MDQISISSVNIVKSWAFLPEPSTISQYFNSNDLIELSKTCKKYRYQLKPQVLKTIIIPQNYSKLYYTSNDFYACHYKFNNIKRRLKIDLLECRHFVNQVIFRHSLTLQFTKYFFALFPNISLVTIENKSYSLECLVEILQYPKSLRCINLRVNSIDYSSIKDKFSKQLKSIKLDVPYDLDSMELDFDFIDSSFSNLSHLTIINKYMLNQLFNGIPSLRFVEFNEDSYFDKPILLKFILNSPQLNKIIIATSSLNYDIVDSILKLKGLYELHLINSMGSNDIDITNCTENFTIKHFKYSGSLYNRTVIGIIKLCKSLKVLETSEYGYRFLAEAAHNDELSEIGTLLITSSSNASIVCLFLPILKIFNQVKFRNGCSLGQIIDQQIRYNNVKWVSKQNYSSYTDEFTLVRIT
jgi:hypothetical protein